MRRESADFIGARSEADCKKAECRAATHPVDQNTRKPGAKGAVHVDKFGAGFAQCAKAARCPVDEHGAELDVLVQKRRDKASAKRFFRMVLRSNPVPRKIVADQLRSYPAAKEDIPELAHVKHVFVKAAARVNNRAENSHQPTRERERRMRGFRDPKRTQEFLSCFGPIRQHFALKRHLLRASLYCKQLAARFVAWCEFTEVTRNPSCAF
jgi:putative transposase